MDRTDGPARTDDGRTIVLTGASKVPVHPDSTDSIPTSADQEDNVSMGATSALRAREVPANLERSLALAAVRAVVLHLHRDREPGPDLAAASALVRDGALAVLVEVG